MNNLVMSWVLTLAGSPWTYVALALVLAIGGVVTFLPSQSLLVALTTLAYAHDGAAISVLWIAIAATFGMVLGDCLTFQLAKLFGLGTQKFLNGERLSRLRQRMRGQFASRPYNVMITGRLIPLGRLATTLASVDAQISVQRFLKYSLVANVIWVTYSMVIASILGVWAERHPVLMVSIAVVISIGLGLLFQKVQSRLFPKEREAN